MQRLLPGILALLGQHVAGGVRYDTAVYGATPAGVMAVRIRENKNTPPCDETLLQDPMQCTSVSAVAVHAAPGHQARVRPTAGGHSRAVYSEATAGCRFREGVHHSPTHTHLSSRMHA